MHNLRKFILVLIAIVSTLLPIPALGQSTITGGYTLLLDSFDELVERQTLGLEAMYFGGQGLQKSGLTAVTPYAFLGGYGYEAFMTGAGASVQTEALFPIGVGLGFGVTDADFMTWAVSVNAQKQVGPKSWYSVLLQGAAGYQQMSDYRNGNYGVYLQPAEWPDTPQDPILFDDLSWISVYFHAVLEVDWGFVKPLVDIGWLASSYRYSGYECGADCFQPGEPTSGDGVVSGGTFGVGLSLDGGPIQIFGGIRRNDAGTILPVSMTIRF